MSIDQVSDASFADIVLGSDKLVLVDYWAEWCGPCKMIAPILEQVDAEVSDSVSIVKVNIDENPETPTKYGIRSIPTLMLFRGGEAIDSRIGAVNKTQLIEWLKSHI